MPTPTAQNACRRLAGASLRSLTEELEALVLDPTATPTEDQRAAYRGLLEAVEGLARAAADRFTGGATRSVAAVRALDNHGGIGDGTSATNTYERARHALALLDSLHGPRAVEVSVEARECGVPTLDGPCIRPAGYPHDRHVGLAPEAIEAGADAGSCGA